MGNKISVGGQAVIEGVMMRGSRGIATAVRTEDGNIVVDFDGSAPLSQKNKFLGLPLIRGTVNLVESLIIGIKTLNYSASLFENTGEEEESAFERWLKGIFKEKSNDVLMGITFAFSFIFAILIFFILPNVIADLFKNLLGKNSIILNLTEGLIRVAILLLYIYLIGRIEDINRLFQYHGAEHKTIFCYENGMPLTPENAKNFKRLHPRCGTNFLFLVMIVSIVLFAFTGWSTSLWERILLRLLLLPVVAGCTYELIRWLGRSKSTISKIIAYPGLMLQLLTTKEPDDEQLEVAIKALKTAEGIDDNDTDDNSGSSDEVLSDEN